MSTQPAPTISLSGNYPLALLPVRVETRFASVSGTTPQYFLYVRIYPDDIHTDTHEPELTETEIEWGRHHLEAATTDARAAWAQLASQFGPPRAAWIARVVETCAAASPPTTPPTRAASWTRAPHTYVLPDYWEARGYLNNARVVNAQSAAVRDYLHTGPQPGAKTTGGVDAGILWMTDFKEALAAGMALSIPVTEEVWTKGLDRLVVFGVKAATTLDAAKQGERLASLLNAQHHTRGLSFLPLDHPTNNTSDAPATDADPNFEVSFRVERGAERCRAGDGSNGDAAAKALGLPVQVFAHTRYAGGTDDRPDAAFEQLDARHANTALWSATWGYYLSHLVSDLIYNMDESLGLARRHFINYVRARGPLPTLCVGRQPYGVLPVISLDYSSYSGQPKEVTELTKLLRALREVWRRSLAGVPRIGANPQQELMQSLGLEPTSSGYVVRNFLGPHYLTYLWDFAPEKFDDLWRTQKRAAWWEEQKKLPQALLTALKYDGFEPRLRHTVATGEAFPLMQPLVQNGGTSETATLAPNYLRWLRQKKNYVDVKSPNFTEADINFKGKPMPLLFMLLRHSLLQEYAQFAARLLPKGKLDARRGDVAENPARFEPELVNLHPDSAYETQTVWKQLDSIVTSLSSTDTVGVYLDKLSADAAQAPELNEFRKSLDWLATRPTAVLERLLTETLDLCSYRLDAWITSLAARRVAELRQTNASGIYLGAYAFVEDLRPASSTGRTYAESGFVHAPSLTHAAAAAVLRNGFLAHGKVNQNGAFAVNLSADRVSLALGLLDAVREGQPLGAVLGYRFERGLHERKLSKFIAPFRKLAPLTTGAGDSAAASTTPSGAQESVAANNVADGLTLYKRWSKGTIPWGTAGLPSAATPNADYTGVYAELQALGKALDSAGDLLVAESVFQTVSGNHARASAVLDSMGRGDAPPPPDIEVVRTPRTGVGLTHRIIVPVADVPAAAPMPGQTGYNPHHVRAYAEPYLNAWVGKLLGDLSNVRCRAEYLDPQTGGPLPAPVWVDLWLKDLDLTPLDLVYMARGTGEPGLSELEQRFIYYQSRKPAPANVPSGAKLRLDFTRQSSWDVGDRGVAELVELAQAVRKLVASARPLEPRDLTWPEDPASDALDIKDIYNRANYAYTALSNTINLLKSTDPEVLREALLNLARFGIPDAVPVSATGDTPEIRRALQEQATGPVLKEAQNRLVAFSKVESISGTATSEEKRQYHTKRLQALFGKNFNVLTRFTVPSDTSANLVESFGASTKLQGGDELASVTWFQRVARVREGATRLGSAMLYAEALNANVSLKFQVAQLPYKAGDVWSALPAGATQPQSAGRMSLVALSAEPLNFADRLAGLFVDEWVETIPHARETTGLTFQYNAPSARPPQAILLAVTPLGHSSWSADTLEATIWETLELSKLRLVDPDTLQEAGSFLPALYFAVNRAGDTISTDFTDTSGKGA